MAFFLSRVFCHEGSKAQRNTKDWCGGFVTNERMNCSPLPFRRGVGRACRGRGEAFFATKARRHKETRRIGAEVLPRMHECGMVFCGELFATKARRHKETRSIGAEVLPRMHECGNDFSFENFTAFNLSTSHPFILLQQSSPYLSSALNPATPFLVRIL